MIKQVPLKTSAYLADYLVEDLRYDFETYIDWLEFSYPLVRTGEWEGNLYPIAYLRDDSKDYVVIMPDDGIDSWVYFKLNSFSVGNDYDLNTYNFSAYFWVNIPDTTASDYDVTWELISTVIERLKDKGASNMTVETDMVFTEYPMIEEKLTWQTNTAFQIDFTMYGDNGCATTVTTGTVVGSNHYFGSYGAKSSAVDAGTKGDTSYDDDYLYVCVKTGVAGAATWKKIPLAVVA